MGLFFSDSLFGLNEGMDWEVEDNASDDEGDDVGDGAGPEHAFKAVGKAEEANGGDEEDDVAHEGEEHGVIGALYGLKEDGGGFGETTEDDSAEVDAEAHGGEVLVEGEVVGVAAKDADDEAGGKFKESHGDNGDDGIGDDDVFEGGEDAVGAVRAVVEADDGLAADGYADDEGDDDGKDFKNDTESAAGVGGVDAVDGADDVIGDDGDDGDGELGDEA